jgi:crotonobetainyl-CoA:carnitine CoA-transferase CaiB-like acyl-CoA transferase
MHNVAGSASQTAADAPLAGIRVLDMSRVVAGPFAGQILADLGADVVKIERLGGGEDLRSLGPPWLKARGGEDTEQSTYFQTVNRGKRSICLDFAKPEGAKIAAQLAARSDVVLENYRTGTLAKYGLGYEDLAAINPRLIYCSITGFGQTGPYADRSGYDYLVQAMGGQMSVTGHPDGMAGAGPMRVGVPIADITTGNNAAIAVLAALVRRNTSGRGQHLDIALYDSQIAILLNAFGAWLNGRSVIPRTGNDHPTAVPNGVFPTADGFILVSTFNDREFARLAEAIGRPEWGQDPRFMRSRDRLANRQVICGLIGDEMRKATKREWMERLNAAKIPCGPINEMADIEVDPQVAARNMVITLDHPQVGPVRMAGSPFKFSESPVAYRRAPPLPSEHTAEVLGELLGLSDDALRRLTDQGII